MNRGFVGQESPQPKLYVLQKLFRWKEGQAEEGVGLGEEEGERGHSVPPVRPHLRGQTPTSLAEHEVWLLHSVQGQIENRNSTPSES